MLVLLVNVAAVLFMTGFIWTMQVVHYPLFDRAGEEAFPAYETAHNRLFSLVAGPGVLPVLATAVLLVLARPPQVPLWAAILGLALFAGDRRLDRAVWGPAAPGPEQRLRQGRLRVPPEHELDPLRRLVPLRPPGPLPAPADVRFKSPYPGYMQRDHMCRSQNECVR